MGCWMNLVDENTGKRVRVKVNDGEIVFPKTAAGEDGRCPRKAGQVELTREQAVLRHGMRLRSRTASSTRVR
jgi:hypothetical protein